MNENPFDRQLWRDFDWDKYLAEKSPKYPPGQQRAEFIKGVEIVRTVARLVQKGADQRNLKELCEFEKTVPSDLLFPTLMTMAMVANTMYQIRHEEGCKLTFAITTLSKLGQLCRAEKVKGSEQILKRFFAELGEDASPQV